MKVVLDEGAYKPVYAHATDAGADIKTPVDFRLWPNKGIDIDTGIHIAWMPEDSGKYAWICSRSSLYKMGVDANGIIDEGYTGSLIVHLTNNGGHILDFKRGDRIAQMIVQRREHESFDEVEELPQTERGANGFGSTGR